MYRYPYTKQESRVVEKDNWISQEAGTKDTVKMYYCCGSK